MNLETTLCLVLGGLFLILGARSAWRAELSLRMERPRSPGRRLVRLRGGPARLAGVCASLFGGGLLLGMGGELLEGGAPGVEVLPDWAFAALVIGFLAAWAWQGSRDLSERLGR